MALEANGSAEELASLIDAAVLDGVSNGGTLPGPVEQILKNVLDGLEQVDERPRFVIDRTGRLIVQSPRTIEALMCIDAIMLRDGKIVAHGTTAQESIDKMLRLQPQSISTIMRKSARTAGHCILRGVGLCEHTVLVTVHCAHPHTKSEIADLSEAFSLTPSEVHVVELLLAGHSPAKIAPRLGVALNTVRSHLRHCYDKMGVSSREELWRTVSPYRLN